MSLTVTSVGRPGRRY